MTALKRRSTTSAKPIVTRAFAGLPLTLAGMLALGAHAGGAEVSGSVRMPPICSTAISPAVVRIEPIDAPAPTAAPEVRFIDQRAMRFDPRVVAMSRGQVLRFGNADGELHNVHIRAGGADFSRGVAPGSTVDFTPEAAGVYRVSCDVHSHMRAFIVVADSPWAAACDRSGRFRFADVPDGRYRLTVWHELGAPLSREITVRGPLDLGTLTVSEGANDATGADRMEICETGCEPWPLVIDRISVTLAAGLDAAGRPDAAGLAVPMVQDAEYRDFQASGMRTAVRLHLGLDRASEIEELFRGIAHTASAISRGEAPAARAVDPIRRTLLALSRASEELNRKGVTERSEIFGKTSPAYWVADGPAAAAPGPDRPRAPMVVAAGLAATLAVGLLIALIGRAARPRTEAA